MKLYVLSSVMILMSGNVLAQSFLDDFPAECSVASDKEALPGHILRLGFINNTPRGWSLLFPDQRIGESLQRVNIADNVGIIGQDPNADLSDMIRVRTPSGSFVVAQVFIGDESGEPVVTCLSRPRMLSSYQPGYYGEDFMWLEPTVFRRWLGFGRYNDWGWRKWYGRDFGFIRNKYREHYHKRAPSHHRERRAHEGVMRDKADGSHRKPIKRESGLRQPTHHHDRNKLPLDKKSGFLGAKEGDRLSPKNLKPKGKALERGQPKKLHKAKPIDEQEQKPAGRGAPGRG